MVEKGKNSCVLEADGTRRIITENWSLALIPEDWDLSDKPYLSLRPNIPKYMLVYQEADIEKKLRIQYRRGEAICFYDKMTDKAQEIEWKLVGCIEVLDRMDNPDMIGFLNDISTIDEACKKKPWIDEE